ncbi:MAG: ABC transporter ATP-binding protein [Tannerellaceae bacterium]|jgi:putative ABC transport system ATP-binding protein|nr:ABC transporter ATP-binding protein [Tannerellaceae bacterium]
MNTFIKLSKINKYYRMGKVKNQVLTDFSCAFEEDCFAILSGPSGSGKSTLLNILATLDKPDSGTYLFNREEVDFGKDKALTEIRKNNFGFVFQSFNLIPVLTALENVALPLTLFNYSRKEQTERANDVLDRVGLKDKLNRKPGELSGGEQQRVAIARAIVTNPKIIFADEPTANLDKRNAENIICLMQRLNTQTGMGFIIASHDAKVIEAGKEVLRIGES